jgi:hypothetical protein
MNEFGFPEHEKLIINEFKERKEFMEPSEQERAFMSEFKKKSTSLNRKPTIILCLVIIAYFPTLKVLVVKEM